MFSAFLHTIFRIAEKITKPYKICYIIFPVFGFLESYGGILVRPPKTEEPN